MVKFFKGEKNFTQPDQALTCHSLRNSTGPDPTSQWNFAPAYSGSVSPSNTKVTFEGNCFESITFELQYDLKKHNTVDFIATLKNKRSLLCSDFFLIANTEIFHVENFFFAGTHKMTFKVPGKNAQEDIIHNGLHTYLFCENLRDELLSVFTTLKSFIGGLGLHGKIPLF